MRYLTHRDLKNYYTIACVSTNGWIYVIKDGKPVTATTDNSSAREMSTEDFISTTLMPDYLSAYQYRTLAFVKSYLAQ